MKMKILLLTMLSAATVVVPAAQSFSLKDLEFDRGIQLAQSYSSQTQETQLSIDLADLSSPHRLEINAPSGARLSGEVLLNGVLFKKLSGQQLQANLAPYLKRGRNVVQVTGSYYPASASVQMTLDGPGVSLSNQTSGSGNLSLRLGLDVW